MQRCSAATRSSSRSRRARGSATELRARLLDAARADRPGGELRRASARSSSWSTRSRAAPAPRFAFIEANPRLQVEHTVTEEVTGRRPRADAAPARRRAHARRARARAGEQRRAARLRDPGAHQRRDDERRRQRASVRRHARRVRAAVGPRRARRRLRLRRLHDEPALRLAAREARRALAVARLRRRARARAARARRVPDRGRGDEPALPAEPARRGPSVAAGAHLHALRRGARGRARRERGRAAAASLLRDRRRGSAGPALAGARVDARDPLAVLDYGKARRRRAGRVRRRGGRARGTRRGARAAAGHDRLDRRARRRDRRAPASRCS